MALVISGEIDINPESFLSHHEGWVSGAITLGDVLQIPRVPAVIGTVPNPSDFSSMSMDAMEDGVLASRPHAGRLGRRLRVGDHPTLRFDPVTERSLMPSIRLMYEHAASVGMRLRGASVSVGGVKMPLNDDRLPARPHLDFAGKARKRMLEYIVADHEPTEFIVGSLKVPDSMTKLGEQTAEIEAQLPACAVAQAESYDILAYDPSMPHRTPQRPTDGTVRTLARVIIQEQS